MEWLISSNNLSDGGIVALKMMAGVVVAAVLLYLVLILSRVLGTKIEEKKYRTYCEKYLSEHGSEEGMLSQADFIETRAKGNAVVWKRQDAEASVTVDTAEQPAQSQSNTAHSDAVASTGDANVADSPIAETKPIESQRDTTEDNDDNV